VTSHLNRHERPLIKVDVWSDVVCPWCYIGKRRFEAALAALGDEADVQVTYRAYQLDPKASGPSMPVSDAYARKFGGAERAAQIIEHVTEVAAESGIGLRMDRALRANTFDAHRLLWLSSATGHQAALKERLLQAYFTDGLDVASHGVLAQCAADVGLPADAVLAFLASDDGADAVRADIDIAGEYGISAVPTFVVNGAWSIPGAQDPETFVTVLRRMAERMRETA
jgi:predicted DsbA family dithiol-disulfide isomerase